MLSAEDIKWTFLLNTLDTSSNYTNHKVISINSTYGEIHFDL